MKVINIPVHSDTDSGDIKKSLELGMFNGVGEYKITVQLDHNAKGVLLTALMVLIFAMFHELNKKKKREDAGNLLNKVMESTTPEEMIQIAKEDLGVEVEISASDKDLTEREKLLAKWRSYDFGPPDPNVPRIGSLKGMIKFVSPDFDEPLEDFEEYMK